MKLKTGGSRRTPSARVTVALSAWVKVRRRRYDARSVTSAVAALIIMITGASASRAKLKATPNAARLYSGDPSRAMIAVRNGPSTDIISHVAARGSQNWKIRR